MIPYITDAVVGKRINEKRAFELARQAFLLIAKHRTQMPPKVYLNLSGKVTGDFRAMPACCRTKHGGVAGIKWVSVFPGNRKRGLPTVIGTLLINSTKTGQPLALMEATVLTALRTAASAALATHYLANPDPKKLALVGAGLQAGYQLKALASRHRFEEVAVWGSTQTEVDIFCRKAEGVVKNIKPYSNLKACVDGADILVTCTPSRKPLVKKEWVKPGAHINAIGADAEGKEELDPALVVSSRVIVDEWQQASHSGEINVPVSRGLFSRKHLAAELAEIVSGRKKGRRSSRDITLFDSTGLAVLDIYFAHFLYRQTSR